MIQAAAIAYAVFGLGGRIEDGHTLDKATMEDGSGFTGVAVAAGRRVDAGAAAGTNEPELV